MRIKRNPEPGPEPRDERLSTEALLCEWSSNSHNRCNKLAEPSMPSCTYHATAVFGMRTAQSPRIPGPCIVRACS